MIAGVVIDAWKLATFKRCLDAAGYIYTEHLGPSPHVRTLKVTCEWIHKLQPIIEAAERECAAAKDRGPAR